MSSKRSLAHDAHPPGEDQDHPHACTDGVVYIGHLVEEVFDAVPCRRCAEEAR
jgi:hypothetical protein